VRDLDREQQHTIAMTTMLCSGQARLVAFRTSRAVRQRLCVVRSMASTPEPSSNGHDGTQVRHLSTLTQ
jgi:hypothetical protein